MVHAMCLMRWRDLFSLFYLCLFFSLLTVAKERMNEFYNKFSLKLIMLTNSTPKTKTITTHETTPGTATATPQIVKYIKCKRQR
jgi:hypothetical protein